MPACCFAFAKIQMKNTKDKGANLIVLHKGTTLTNTIFMKRGLFLSGLAASFLCIGQLLHAGVSVRGNCKDAGHHGT